MPGLNTLDIYEQTATVQPGAPTGPWDASFSGGLGGQQVELQRYDFNDNGPSSGTIERGQPVDPETGGGAAPYENVATHDMHARFTSTTIVALQGDEGWSTPDAAEDRNKTILPPFTAGYPTDDGRPARTVERNWLAPITFDEANWMGMKLDTPSPIATTAYYDYTSVPGAWPSPGGSGPAIPDPDPIAMNTWRVPPTPWDEYRYIGGPMDG